MLQAEAVLSSSHRGLQRDDLPSLEMGPTLLTVVLVLGSVFIIWLSLGVLNRVLVKFCRRAKEEDTDKLQQQP